MIREVHCAYGEDNKRKREELKRSGFISSVEISQNADEYGIQHSEKSKVLKKMFDICKDSMNLHSVDLIISGYTHKHWFMEDQISILVKRIKDE